MDVKAFGVTTVEQDAERPSDSRAWDDRATEGSENGDGLLSEKRGVCVLLSK
jgi:hypothetical protein